MNGKSKSKASATGGSKGPGLNEELRAPSDREVTAARDAAQWLLDKPKPPQFVHVGDNAIGPAHSDSKGFGAHVNRTLATNSADFVNHALRTAAYFGTPRETPDDPEEKIRQEVAAYNMGLALIADIGPKGELETALALQMVGSHHMTVDMMKRAQHAKTVELSESYTGLAVKTGRLFREQIEALAKLRSAGKQVVEVIHVHKHVYVAPGGQAVVTDIYNGRGSGDGGGPHPNLIQPQATDAVGPAILPEVWSQDAEREALQIADREEPSAVPDARLRPGRRGA